MPYRHDIFISYRRQEYWTPWTRERLKSLLAAYLQPELGRPAEIFVDEHIEIGEDWVDSLGTHLGAARVLVAVLSGDYFSSPWCVHELDLMLGRQATQIVPLVVHNCEELPNGLDRNQTSDFKDFWVTDSVERMRLVHATAKAGAALRPSHFIPPEPPAYRKTPRLSL